MKVKRIVKIDCPLSAETIAFGERVLDLEEAVIGFTNAGQARAELTKGLRQHGVCLIADIRVTVELIPLNSPGGKT